MRSLCHVWRLKACVVCSPDAYKSSRVWGTWEVDEPFTQHECAGHGVAVHVCPGRASAGRAPLLAGRPRGELPQDPPALRWHSLSDGHSLSRHPRSCWPLSAFLVFSWFFVVVVCFCFVLWFGLFFGEWGGGGKRVRCVPESFEGMSLSINITTKPEFQPGWDNTVYKPGDWHTESMASMWYLWSPVSNITTGFSVTFSPFMITAVCDIVEQGLDSQRLKKYTGLKDKYWIILMHINRYKTFYLKYKKEVYWLWKWWPVFSFVILSQTGD